MPHSTDEGYARTHFSPVAREQRRADCERQAQAELARFEAEKDTGADRWPSDPTAASSPRGLQQWIRERGD